MGCQPFKCAAATLCLPFTACQIIHNVLLTSWLRPYPLIPFPTGISQRYFVKTHSLCSETSVLNKNVFCDAPRGNSLCRRPRSIRTPDGIDLACFFQLVFNLLLKSLWTYLGSIWDAMLGSCCELFLWFFEIICDAILKSFVHRFLIDLWLMLDTRNLENH